MDLKEKFKKWWMNDNSLQKNEDKYAETTKKGYFRALEKLNENKQIDVFIIENIKELKIILARLKTGDLRSYNQRNQNVDTSAGLEQYIKFMENRKDKEKLKKAIKKFVARSLEGKNTAYKDIFSDLKKYNEFKLNPSFGKGNVGNISWIGFLKYGQKPQNGIYPSICFHRLKNPKYITVEKAVSNDNPPNKMWDWKENDNPNYSENKARTRVKYDINTIDDLSDKILENIVQNLEDVMQDFEELFPNKKPIGEGEGMSKIKNIILYGVPGVGKTYNTKKLISLLEMKQEEKDIFSQIEKNSFNDDKEATRIVENIKDRVKFLTFHQSFGYEDFIEGFRPNEDGNIDLSDGVFKSFCDSATKNINKSHSLEKLIFDDAFDILLKERIENQKFIRIELNRENSFYEIYDYNKRSIYYTRQGSDKEEGYHTLSINTLKRMYESENDNIITGGLKTYYRPLLKKLLEIGKKEKIERIERKNFYLVIDEINRGNISKIFGELITLIEEDKRDSLHVTLPYSKEEFSIPSNLYIIGTMNSTDKSIALIDVALRRRFTFLKLLPNLELIKNEKAKQLMKNLNDKIVEILDEEHSIGHSYFMNNEEDLEFVKEYKLKPLLEEYFYGDKDGFNSMLEVLNSNS